MLILIFLFFNNSCFFNTCHRPTLLLDKYYLMYKKQGIKVPTEVIKFTLEFQKQCDIYTDYIIEKLEETKDMDDILDLSEMYDEFKIWYEDTFSNHKYPSKVEFKKYLIKRKTIADNYFLGQKQN